MRVFTVVQIVEKLWANVQDMLSTPVSPLAYSHEMDEDDDRREHDWNV